MRAREGSHMVNDEHVALLRQGVIAWNKWRHDPRVILDLTVCLTTIDLSGSNFSGADLSGVDLSQAAITGTWPNLSAAILIKADLSNADLRGANLSRADLRGANLAQREPPRR